MGLVEIKTEKTEVDEDVIARLEKALVLARAGKFYGVAIVGAYRDGSSYTSSSKCVDRHALIAGLAIVQHDLIEGTKRVDV